MGVESSSDTQQPIVLFCFWFVAGMKEFVLFTLGLGERRMVTRPTLVKNFCAWLRICTAVLVPMCSARTHARTEKKSVSACPRPDEERPTAQRQRERGRPDGRYVPCMRRQARPCSCRASRNRRCSSSVHFSRCFVIVYGFRAWLVRQAWNGRNRVRTRGRIDRTDSAATRPRFAAAVYLGHVLLP